MDAVTSLLRDLVAIPSVNPMGRTVDGPEYLEGGITAYLERWFRDLGVAFERRTILPGRDNIIARYDSPGARHAVLLDAHQDTVPTDGMTISPFDPVVDGGKLRGRGSCDIKGGMAAMLTAFARLAKDRPKGASSVIMACTVDEEFTHKGSSALAEMNLGADLAIVAEPTMLNLIDRHKGAVRWKIVTKGVACHSSSPRLGNNAIYRMAQVVGVLAEHAEELLSGPGDAVLGTPTLSVGRIDGGRSVNVVPDRCEIEIDRRVIPGETRDTCIGLVRDAVRKKLGSLDDIEFLDPWVNMPPLSPRNGSESWIEPLSTAVKRATGRAPTVGGVPYGTDAGPLCQTGLACFVFGPGDIAQAHTKDEWVELDQVRSAADAYYEMFREIG